MRGGSSNTHTHAHTYTHTHTNVPPPSSSFLPPCLSSPAALLGREQKGKASPLSMQQLTKMASDIAEGMNYLSLAKIVHRCANHHHTNSNTCHSCVVLGLSWRTCHPNLLRMFTLGSFLFYFFIFFWGGDVLVKGSRCTQLHGCRRECSTVTRTPFLHP